MKRRNILFAGLIFCIPALSQSFTPTDAGSKVHFMIKNFGIKTGGDFTGLKGSIVFDPAALSESRFNVTVDAKSINTDMKVRDNHLRKDDYFDVEKYPVLSLKSIKVTKSNIDGRYFVIGNLTIKNITKEVQFGFNATPSGTGYLFTGSFDINRRDFGVGGNSRVLSDNLTVTLSVAANK